MPAKLSDCVAAAIGNKIYIAGGLDVSGKYSNAIYLFEPTATSYGRYGSTTIERWTKKTHLNENITSNIGMAKLEEKLYVVVNRTTVYTFDTTTDIWTKVCSMIYVMRVVFMKFVGENAIFVSITSCDVKLVFLFQVGSFSFYIYRAIEYRGEMFAVFKRKNDDCSTYLQFGKIESLVGFSINSSIVPHYSMPDLFFIY